MPQKYHPALRTLHWLMAVLILSMLALGTYMAELPRSAPMRGDLYALHKSIGVTLFFLLLLRMVVRLGTVVPPLPPGINAWERGLAELTHAAFYVLLCLMPLSGIIMSNAFGMGVAWFGFGLPRIVEPDRNLGKLAGIAHEWLGYGLLVLIAAHVAGVVKHRFFDKNDVLDRML